MDPRTADLVRFLEGDAETHERPNRSKIFKGNAGIHGPPMRSEFLKAGAGTHGRSNRSKIFKGNAGIHGSPIWSDF